MKLSEVVKILEATVLVGEECLDNEISSVAATDLMSDLLKNNRDQALLLTGLCNIHAVRSAFIAGVAAVAIVRGKKPTSEMIEHARGHGLALLTTPLNLYSSCGRLFSKGAPSIR